MEDLKQIQEFFLNENVFVEAFKLEKALKGMGYNVKVKALDDFGKNVFEIYFNNPADADDDSIFYDAKKLGYDNVRVFANPQESVSEVDRYSGFNRNPEDPDSEKFEPTGSVAEFKEDLRALFGKFKGDLKNPEFIKGVAQIMVNWKALLRSQLEESTKPDSLKSLLDKYDLDMGWYKKHLIGIDNLSPEEESDLEYVEDRIKSHLSVSEADLNDPVAMKMRAAKMKADKLAKLRAANAGDDGNDKFFEKSTARLRKLKALKDKRAQIMIDMEQEAEIEGGAVADKYGDMLNKLDKAISMLGEAVNDPRIDNSKFGPSPRKFAELRAQMGDEALLDKIQMMDVNILVDVLDEYKFRIFSQKSSTFQNLMKVLTQTNSWGQSREDKTIEILKKQFGDDNVNAIGKLGSKEDMIGGIDCEVIVDGVKKTAQIKPFTGEKEIDNSVMILGTANVKRYSTDWLIFTRNNKEVLIFDNKHSKIMDGQYIFPKEDLIYTLS